jgi:CBS domain-containing protein
MRLSEICAAKLVTAGPQESLSTVTQRMEQHNVGAVVVVDGQKPVGIVTDRDLALALGARRADTETPVESVMATPVRTIPDGAGIFAATQCMRDAGVRRLPIVDVDGRLVGIITLDDLLRLLGWEFYNLTEGIKREMKTK